MKVQTARCNGSMGTCTCMLDKPLLAHDLPKSHKHCAPACLQIPFVKAAPMVTFKKPIGSVSVSGHKFVGAPVPCGVVITRMRYVMALSRSLFPTAASQY
jgi:hypothetical protein